LKFIIIFSKIKGQKTRTYSLYTLIHYRLPAEKKHIYDSLCFHTAKKISNIKNIVFCNYSNIFPYVPIPKTEPQQLAVFDFHSLYQKYLFISPLIFSGLLLKVCSATYIAANHITIKYPNTYHRQFLIVINNNVHFPH